MQKQNVILMLYLTENCSARCTFYPILTMYPLKLFYDLYMFAEYGSGSPVSMDGDIYSYGVLLLEMFTGRRPTDNFINGMASLIDYVKTAYPNNLLEILDTNATYNGNTQDMTQLVVYPIFRLGLACCKESPRERMKMDNVVKELNAIKKAFSAHTYA